ncbi:MAG: DUF5107 domain-containing protein, partial [Bacteroidetes bacterium]|nr:DUF5107 domain-containing protein [Bacteroidota bacterium]
YKIGKRGFIYYNRFIKPALVGLSGPWISGGIEFNWPQHHRPGTFSPVDFSIEEHADGSKTVWINEVENMFHTKGMAGFTLHPDKAYLEISARLLNRTPLPQTFLWWANPAVKVNDHYQSVFPPDVNAVFDHGKRDVSSFPIATGTYYKVDYSPGTDISRYKNIPVPTSYMAIRSNYDFMGGYEHDARAGVLHVADHHVSPGKKQWTWGHGDFGRAWDRNLTDEDGPYIELMAGVFTDNQPDFTWLMPYEEKSFVQYFLPYRELGMVRNATKDLLAGIEKTGDLLTVRVFATSPQDGLVLRLFHDGRLLDQTRCNARPEDVFVWTLPVEEGIGPENLSWQIVDGTGRELLSDDPVRHRGGDIPEPAKAALAPEQISNNEQLYLTGLHLEQYRHATYSPLPYYQEALRRDPGDIRSNNALGLWYLRRGQFKKSEPFFRKAIATLTSRNPNPYDGEPFYNLGLALQLQGRTDEAYDQYYKACWSSAWQAAAWFSLAQLDMVKGDWQRALEHVGHALDRNRRNSRAWMLKAVILRKTGQSSREVCIRGLELDEFNLPLYFELFKNERGTLDRLRVLARGSVQNYITYALDYAAAGQYSDAIEFLSLYTGAGYPMVGYYLAWWHHLAGNDAVSTEWLLKAAAIGPGHCFPNRLEDIAVLRYAGSANKEDAKAPYYLGNLWYDRRQYDEAIQQWQLSAARDGSFSTVARNLGIAYFNKKGDPDKALGFYTTAFLLDETDARVLMELDQLRRRLNFDPRQRLDILERHLPLVEQRDDLYLERAALYNFLGSYERAWQLIMDRKFHPWEGGEGKVSGQYIYSLVEMAKQDIHAGQLQRAIGWLEKAQVYPHSLGEGKLPGARENDIFYWLGIACERAGDPAQAAAFFQRAAQGDATPAAALFYNDQQPDKIFYQGLALKKLGSHALAERIFDGLLEYGVTHLEEEVRIDYFAVSLPDLLIFEDDGKTRHQAHCYYMMGLSHLGSGRKDEATGCLQKVLGLDAMHFGARTHLVLAGKKKEEAFITI